MIIAIDKFNFSINVEIVLFIDIVKYFHLNIIDLDSFQLISCFLLFEKFLHCYGYAIEIENLFTDFNSKWIFLIIINA